MDSNTRDVAKDFKGIDLPTVNNHVGQIKLPKIPEASVHVPPSELAKKRIAFWTKAQRQRYAQLVSVHELRLYQAYYCVEYNKGKRVKGMTL